MRWIYSARGRLTVALITGTIAAGMAWNELERARQRMEDRYRMTTVLRAKKYIPAGKPVTPDLVEEESVPDVFRQPTAMEPAAFRAERDPLHARIGLLKGEQITRSKLYDGKDSLGLAWAIPAGLSAASLRLPREYAVSGLVRPGDRVNVFCTRARSSDNDRPRTDLLFSNVRVAAVGDRIWNPEASFETSSMTQSIETEPILVTLLITVRDAAIMAFAAENGRISLALSSALEEVDSGAMTVGASHLGRTP